MKGGRSRGKTATTGPHACGCWDAVAAQYGVDRFGITTIPIRQRQFRRPATYVPAPLLPSLLRPGGRGGGDVRLRLWLWLLFEGHARSESDGIRRSR